MRKTEMRLNEVKIGRNDPCPCGSGKKYKKCCLNKSEENRFAEAIRYSISNIKNEARIKHCLHPNKDECSEKIVKAHAIQNNRILNRIAENGMVITLDGAEHLLFQSSDIKGRKVATTFTGFCSYHDKALFQEIEDKDFSGTDKQIFLFTYRTMAWHFHKKLEHINATCIQFEKMLSKGYDISKSEDFLNFLTGLKMGYDDNEIEKAKLDTALLSESYGIINALIWEIPYEIHFVISMMTELEHDIKGNKINDLEKDDYTKKIYLNVFPSQGKSFCIWSWLRENDCVYKPFAEQFSSLGIKDRENYFNNNLPRWSDSIIISPRLWEKWGKQIQESFIVHANFDILYRQMEKETGDYKYSYAETPWNLFENLSC